MMKTKAGMIAGGLIALLVTVGCEKDYRPKDVDTNKVEAAVKSLNHDAFNKLNSNEKFDFLTIITKTHNVPYVIGPSDVQMTVNERPGVYPESIFKMHKTDDVAAFLKAELDAHLDSAPKIMTGDDAKVRNHEVRLVNRLATDYLQALVAMNLSEEYRNYKEKAGPQAPDPYMAADAELVNAADNGLVQLYMVAAREGDAAKVSDLRAKIAQALKPYEDKTVDFTPPKVSATMTPKTGL